MMEDQDFLCSICNAKGIATDSKGEAVEDEISDVPEIENLQNDTQGAVS